MTKKRIRWWLAFGTLVALAGAGWRYRQGPLPPWTSRQAASHLSELDLPRGRTVRYEPQWSLLNTDVSIDVVLDFTPHEFDRVVASARVAGYEDLTGDDENRMHVQSVAENADSALYRLWKADGRASWRMAVVDLRRLRLYASEVRVGY